MVNVHGNVTHTTENCYIRPYNPKQLLPPANAADDHETDTDDTQIMMQDSHNSIKDLETHLHKTEVTYEGKTNCIHDSSANLTYITGPHACMKPCTWTLTATALGPCAPVTEKGNISVTLKRNKITIPTIHTSKT